MKRKNYSVFLSREMVYLPLTIYLQTMSWSLQYSSDGDVRSNMAFMSTHTLWFSPLRRRGAGFIQQTSGEPPMCDVTRGQIVIRLVVAYQHHIQLFVLIQWELIQINVLGVLIERKI